MAFGEQRNESWLRRIKLWEDVTLDNDDRHVGDIMVNGYPEVFKWIPIDVIKSPYVILIT
jgi:hypothetical protein